MKYISNFFNVEMSLKKKLFVTSLIFIFFSIFYLSGFFKYYIMPVIYKNNQQLFYDSQTVSSWIECYKLGYEVIKKNECTFNSTIATYGKIILYIPINEYLKFFYNIILPIFSFFFYIFFNFYFNKSKNISHFILILLAICNQRNITAFERGQFDIYIYFLVIYLAYVNKNNLIIFGKTLLLSFFSLTKLYPFILISYSFFYKKKFIIIIISCLIPSIFYILFNIEHYKSVISTIPQPSIRWDFSFMALPKHYKDLDHVYKNIIIFYLSIVIIFILYFLKNFNKIKFNFDLKQIEEKLFLLSSNLILFCYFFSHNYYYREIFFTLCIPLFIKLSYKKNIYFMFCYFFILRYFYIIISNHFIMFRYEINLAIIQQILDLILIFILLLFSLKINLEYISKILRK